MRTLFIILLMITCITGLSACGKKQARLDPPDRKLSAYPRTYPDPKDSDY